MKFDAKQIMGMLPHAYPFLLVDRVLACVPGQSLQAMKNVTYNEPFFAGHFPGNPVMPGVLIVESMAQASMLCVVCELEEKARLAKSVYFMSIDSAKFRKVVSPGDTLVITTDVLHRRSGSYKFQCSAHVDDELVSEARIMAMVK